MLDANSYDEVPYPSYPYALTHPERMSTIAWLLGLEVVRRPYRVLELGCASGGNLIPMAAWNPDCQFLGVDLSGAQIEEGNQWVQRLGLNNIALRHASILDLDLQPASFDYIICHGVYSWVPPAVQAKILELCRVCLSESGVAIISYNTHPGWRQRGALRDMMRYHVERIGNSEASQRIKQARELIEFLVQATLRSDSSYARMLKEQLQLLKGHSDAYIYHEHLEEINEPIWFSNFCARLEKHDLRFLGEAEFGSMVGCIALEGELQEQLDRIAPSLIEQEQYMDFVRNRAFRQTLVCHAARTPDYQVRGARLESLFAASPGSVMQSNESSGQPKWRVALGDGLSIETDVRATQVAFELLSHAWPRRIAVRTLIDQVREQLSDEDTPSDLGNVVSVALLTAFVSGSGLLELGTENHPSSATPSAPHPTTSQVVRAQAKQLDFVVNWRHQAVQIMPVDRRILPLLDGQTSSEAVVATLCSQFVGGDLKMTDSSDQPLHDVTAVEEMLRQLVKDRIDYYGRCSLIVD